MSDQSAPLLCVVPARGGSRGIPRKWAQPVDGVPLILRTLETVKQSGVADRIVISTEDSDIKAFCRLRGYEVVDRPAEYAADDIPLSDVVCHVVETLTWDGDVLVAQATCPLLTVDTIVTFTERFRQSGLDWAISAAPVGHIVWNGADCLSPRVNRQQLPTHIKQETGALQIMSAAYALIPHGTRGTIEIPADQALDIDTHGDLAAARMTLERRTVEFRVVASDEKGAGHLWRCLQLSDALSHHNVRWQQTGLDGWAQDIVRRRGIEFTHAPWLAEHHWSEGFSCPDLLIVDCLEAAETVVPLAKSYGIPVVLFEHDGPACRMADLVVDEFADPRWTVLRPEFMCLPKKEMSPKGNRVLVTFGGSDVAGLNERVGAMLGCALDAEVRVVAGPASTCDKAGRATVLRDVSMAEQMMWADLVVTGQGRTVAEAVACGTPVVSLAQNERESRHARLPGVLYLGLFATVSDEALIRCVSRLLERPALRQEMVSTASAAVDGRGVERIVFEVERLLRGL